MIQTAWEIVVAPFADFAFMRRALVASMALALGAAPLGVLLTLRRMSLLGDALSHAVLPGVAVGFAVAGLSLPAMAMGGVVAGLLVAGFAGFVSRATSLPEDSSLAAMYLVALALGVALISRQGSQLDLLHILFGSALSVDVEGLVLVVSVATLSVLGLALGYRGLVLEAFDPMYLQATGCNVWHSPWIWQQGFLMLVVFNLVAGFQTMGTLMSVGLMMLPAVGARLWHDTLGAQIVHASVQAMVASVGGLLLSYHWDTPSGPTIVGFAGALYGVSLLLAPSGYLPRLLKHPHRVA